MKNYYRPESIHTEIQLEITQSKTRMFTKHFLIIPGHYLGQDLNILVKVSFATEALTISHI